MNPEALVPPTLRLAPEPVNPVEIREGMPEDALRIATLYQDAYAGTYPDPLMREILNLKGALCSENYCWMIARVGAEVVASVVYQVDEKNRLARTFGAVVQPSYRGQKLTQRLLERGLAILLGRKQPIDVVYATTRTVLLEPQKLTENLGYRKLGVFPNVHKTAQYETHCLAAWFSPLAIANRFTDFALHPKLLPLFSIVQRECALPSLPIAESVPEPKDSENRSEPMLEAITAPVFSHHRFLTLKAGANEHAWFFPFQGANSLLTSPDQSTELFLHRAEDGHVAILGIVDRRGYGLLPILRKASEELRNLGARYIEFIVRADELEKIEAALRCRYIPSAYFPSMHLHGELRYDYVVFSRTFEILDFSEVHLQGVNREFVTLYSKSWETLALGPALQ